jgi:hypothetical protein
VFTPVVAPSVFVPAAAADIGLAVASVVATGAEVSVSVVVPAGVEVVNAGDALVSAAPGGVVITKLLTGGGHVASLNSS